VKIAPLVFAVVVFSASPATAHDWFVNSTHDRVDIRPGDRICDTGFTADDGTPECTLRAAVQEANAPTALRRSDEIHLPAGEYVLTLAVAAGEDEDRNQLASTWDIPRALQVGDLDIASDMRITGAGAATIINGGALDRVFDVWGSGLGGEVVFRQMIIRNGFTRNQGGCIQNRTTTGPIVWLVSVIVQECIAHEQVGGGMYNNGYAFIRTSMFRNNTAGRGGAIENSGLLNIDESAFYSNTTLPLGHEAASGGAISNISVHGEAPGLLVRNSTFFNNIVDDPGGRGGAILNRGAMDVINSTVSGNSADFGGGIWFGPAATAAGRGDEAVWIVSSTIVNNQNGGLYRTGDLPMHVRESIVAFNNTGPGSLSLNCVGGVTDSEHSIENATTCPFSGTGDMTREDPLIGPLADNGGPTQTHALLPGSPALDRVSHPRESRDQRGYPRPIFTNGDIGAYEKGFDIVLLLDIDWLTLFRDIFTTTTMSYQVDLALKIPGQAANDLIEPRIIGVKGANGPVQFTLADDGKSIKISGVFTPPKDQSNSTLFYLEVQPGFKTPSLLKIENVSCKCDARPRKNPPPIVIPAANQK
jgi:hypothetical protein